jgi:hypothetical protein
LVDRVATLSRVLEELGAGSSARITQAESQVIQDELCHAWQCGDETALAAVPHMSVRAAKVAMKMTLDK